MFFLSTTENAAKTHTYYEKYLKKKYYVQELCLQELHIFS